MTKILIVFSLALILCSCGGKNTDNELSDESIDFDYSLSINSEKHEIDSVSSLYYTQPKQLSVKVILKEDRDSTKKLKRGDIAFNFKLLERTFRAFDDPLAEKMSTSFNEELKNGGTEWYSSAFGEFMCKTTVTELTKTHVSIKFSGMIESMSFSGDQKVCKIKGFIKGVKYERTPEKRIHTFPMK